jgi:hypothetical protein
MRTRIVGEFVRGRRLAGVPLSEHCPDPSFGTAW